MSGRGRRNGRGRSSLSGLCFPLCDGFVSVPPFSDSNELKWFSFFSGQEWVVLAGDGKWMVGGFGWDLEWCRIWRKGGENKHILRIIRLIFF